MDDEIRKMKDTLSALREYQEKADHIVSYAENHTPCGFSWNEMNCRGCLHKADCDESRERSVHTAWNMRMRALREYSRLEEKARKMLKESGETAAGSVDAVELQVLLAKVLRNLADNDLILGEDSGARFHEAEQLFLELYYQTGSPGYKEEAESCRLLAMRRQGSR